MAQASQPLGYICRSCRHALKSSSTLRTPTSIRGFSSTPTRSKTLATFTSTSSPELDALLSRWRSEVFLPSVLPPHHTALIYQASKRDILTTPPGVTVTVQTAFPPNAKNASEAEDENIKLQPMNKFDRPSQEASIRQITDVLSKSDDAATWDNLIPFLEGMHVARMSIGQAFVPRLARKANLQGKGRWNTILTAATLAKRTDVRLDQRELTRELVLGAHDRGAVAAFANNAPSKTVERIVLMLEADEHCGKHHSDRVKRMTDGDTSLSDKERLILRAYSDMRRDPLVVAASLSFASAQAIRDSKGKDTDGTVAKAAQKYLAIVDSLEGGLIQYLQEQNMRPRMQKSKKHMENRSWWRDSQVLEELAVIKCALTLANKVDMQPTLGKEKNIQVHSATRKQLDMIQPEIAAATTSVRNGSEDGEKPRRCFQMLDAVQNALKQL
ncbi:hypothetical protein PMZ80_010520 [Knufia obscura]|uniref:Uncharacterized protein n=1 Tax=Knufia obscura TaxID=1635080 RepID=A0ABR0RAD7_9EURO|nr:hypothetical protein PMZ80_010520 [Knufia obscura]